MSNNLSGFRKNLSERIQKLIMATDGKIRDEKLKYDMNRQVAEISALSSGKIDNINILQVKKYYPRIKEE